MRLNKYLAKCGIGSRRKCDEYIKNGKIKVNGKVISDFSYNVNPGSYIQFNNKLINKLEDLTYILNKPKGYICSKKDNLDRKIIYDLIPDGLNFFSIGRLDYDTSGIIIITNDGDLRSATKKNLKSALGKTTDPISLPSQTILLS